MTARGRRGGASPGAASAMLLVWVVAAAAAGGASPPRDPDPVPARLELRGGQAWDVELLGRHFQDRILLRRTDSDAFIEFPVADIVRLDVRLGFDTEAVGELLRAEAFEAAADRLAEGLAPLRPYVTDAAGNLAGLFRAWMLACYWAERYDAAREVADRVVSRTADSRLHRDALRIRALSDAATGAGAPVDPAPFAEPAPDPNAPEASLHEYTLAVLAMQREDWDTAHQALARLVTFRARDFEWMPAALYQSAILHARTNRLPVARQLVQEIQLVYPGTRWAKRAGALDLEALVPPPPPPPPDHPLRRRPDGA